MAPLRPLGRDRCLELLASVPVGRVVFTLRALPAIRPVNHIVDGDTIVFRSSLAASLASAAIADGAVVVAYEADEFDPQRRSGWTVVVTGAARLILDEERLARYERAVEPWVNEPMTCVIGIECDLVTGYELPADAPGPH